MSRNTKTIMWINARAEIDQMGCVYLVAEMASNGEKKQFHSAIDHKMLFDGTALKYVLEELYYKMIEKPEFKEPPSITYSGVGA